MPRTARASAGNFVCHVLNRGNARAEIFHKDEDYAAFVKLLAAACERLPLRVIGYCLMPNHFHLVLWPHAVRHSLIRGTPFGTERWQKQAARQLGLESTLHPRGRPRMGKSRMSLFLLHGSGWSSKALPATPCLLFI